LINAMKPKDNRDNPTRRRILRAAQRLFADAGYEGVSVSELARAARVNRAMLYYYFKDKRDLYRQTIINVLELIPALWERRDVAAGAAAERLDKYLTALWRALSENRDAVVMIMREISVGGPERETIVKRYLLPNAAHVAEILGEGMASGDFKKSPPLAAAVAILSGIIMPNFGLAAARPLLGNAVGAMADDGTYVDYYRGYVRRALGVPEKGGVKRGAGE
jgi:TetR/AcrR family transcriptional regulator